MSTPPLDLEPIRKTARMAVELAKDAPTPLHFCHEVYALHVPLLLAEIDRLRECVAELEAHQETSRG